MPLYEYGCEGCGHRLEAQQKLADPPLKTCPACGKDLLQKIISPTAFVLKGSGWYKDGYSGGKEKRSEKQVTDRLQKAVDDDKKKSSAPAESSSRTGSSSSESTTPTGGGDKSKAQHTAA